MGRVSGVSPGYPDCVEREVGKARIYSDSLAVANSLATWSGMWEKNIEINIVYKTVQENARRYIYK